MDIACGLFCCVSNLLPNNCASRIAKSPILALLDIRACLHYTASVQILVIDQCAGQGVQLALCQSGHFSLPETLLEGESLMLREWVVELHVIGPILTTWSSTLLVGYTIRWSALVCLSTSHRLCYLWEPTSCQLPDWGSLYLQEQQD